MVDGKHVAKVASDDEVRSWLARYRTDHAEDDPDAVHVQVLELAKWSWMSGGKLIPRENFLS
jgi:hypothetical protein